MGPGLNAALAPAPMKAVSPPSIPLFGMKVAASDAGSNEVAANGSRVEASDRSKDEPTSPVNPSDSETPRAQKKPENGLQIGKEVVEDLRFVTDQRLRRRMTGKSRAVLLLDGKPAYEVRLKRGPALGFSAKSPIGHELNVSPMKIHNLVERHRRWSQSDYTNEQRWDDVVQDMSNNELIHPAIQKDTFEQLREYVRALTAPSASRAPSDAASELEVKTWALVMRDLASAGYQ